MSDSLKLATQLVEEEPSDAIPLLSEMPSSELGDFLRLLPKNQRGHILEMLPANNAASCLEALPPEIAIEWLSDIKYPYKSRIARSIQTASLKTLLGLMPKRVARQIQKDIAYPRNSVGAWMENAVCLLNADETIAAATQRLRRLKQSPDSSIVVIADNDAYIGLISANQLLSGSEKRKIGDLVDRTIKPLNPDHLIADVIYKKEWSTHFFLPVTGIENKLLGTLNFANLKTALEQNANSGLPAGGLVGHMLEAAFITITGIGRMLPKGIEPNRVEQRRRS